MKHAMGVELNINNRGLLFERCMGFVLSEVGNSQKWLNTLGQFESDNRALRDMGDLELEKDRYFKWKEIWRTRNFHWVLLTKQEKEMFDDRTGRKFGFYEFKWVSKGVIETGWFADNVVKCYGACQQYVNALAMPQMLAQMDNPACREVFIWVRRFMATQEGIRLRWARTRGDKVKSKHLLADGAVKVGKYITKGWYEFRFPTFSIWFGSQHSNSRINVIEVRMNTSGKADLCELQWSIKFDKWIKFQEELLAKGSFSYPTKAWFYAFMVLRVHCRLIGDVVRYIMSYVSFITYDPVYNSDEKRVYFTDGMWDISKRRRLSQTEN
jgi:hypothetical protein